MKLPHSISSKSRLAPHMTIGVNINKNVVLGWGGVIHFLLVPKGGSKTNIFRLRGGHGKKLNQDHISTSPSPQISNGHSLSLSQIVVIFVHSIMLVWF